MQGGCAQKRKVYFSPSRTRRANIDDLSNHEGRGNVLHAAGVDEFSKASAEVATASSREARAAAKLQAEVERLLYGHADASSPSTAGTPQPRESELVRRNIDDDLYDETTVL